MGAGHGVAACGNVGARVGYQAGCGVQSVERYYLCRRGRRGGIGFRWSGLFRAVCWPVRTRSPSGLIVLSSHLAEVGAARRVAQWRGTVYGVDTRNLLAARESKRASCRSISLARRARSRLSRRMAGEDAGLVAAVRVLAGRARRMDLEQERRQRAFVEEARGSAGQRVVAADAFHPDQSCRMLIRVDVCVAGEPEGLGFLTLESIACGTTVVAAAWRSAGNITTADGLTYPSATPARGTTPSRKLRQYSRAQRRADAAPFVCGVTSVAPPSTVG